MNSNSLLENLVASLIYAVLAYLGKRLWKSLKGTKAAPEKISSKTVLQRQFFVSLFVCIASLVVFCSIGFKPIPDALSVIKVLAGLFAVLSFLIVWGAFEAAFAFYPDDEVISKPSDEHTDHGKQ